MVLLRFKPGLAFNRKKKGFYDVLLSELTEFEVYFLRKSILILLAPPSSRLGLSDPRNRLRYHSVKLPSVIVNTCLYLHFNQKCTKVRLG